MAVPTGWGAIGAAIMLAAGGCHARTDPAGGPAGSIAAPATPATIGIATQEADGTIVLTLRADGAGGAIGDGQLRYPPDSPHYETIRRHVGAIPRGGSVAVKPFPES